MGKLALIVLFLGLDVAGSAAPSRDRGRQPTTH